MVRAGAAWILFGLLCVSSAAQQSKPTFEVVSIRARTGAGRSNGPSGPPTGMPTSRITPDVFYESSITVTRLIRFAYEISPQQLVGGPDWMSRTAYEVNAKTSGRTDVEQMRLMMQSLLEERFKLVARREERRMKHEELRLQRNDGRLGPHLESCKDPTSPPAGKPIAIPPGTYLMPLGGVCAPLSKVVEYLSPIVNVPVLDKTGLNGLWNFTLRFADPSFTGVSELPSLRTALQEDLGLRLQSAEGPVTVLVVEAVELPTEN